MTSRITDDRSISSGRSPAFLLTAALTKVDVAVNVWAASVVRRGAHHATSTSAHRTDVSTLFRRLQMVT